ncbi:MAG: AbrB/MazE/SpoVT family DNA-binding domain-containing protein [Thermodesulfovibrionales bacterium]|jgi:antitoxin MazE
MKVNIVSIGNSKGIRIPKSILEQCNFNKEADLEVENNKLVIKPVKKKIRDGWDSALRLMHECKEDALLVDDSLDSEMKSWEW